MVYALILSYRGEPYSGWQRQNNALTVQQVVEEALSDLLRRPVEVQGASRTDAGVHARGQVAHLTLDEEFPVRGLQHGTNQRLPEEVRVMGAFRMREGFHARKCATSKEYRYTLIRERTLSPLDALFAISATSDLDLAAMRAATLGLVGKHDFTAFALAGGGHGQPFRRIQSAAWLERGSALEFCVVGDGFLRGMVRSMVGTLIEVGRGRLSVSQFQDLLKGKPRQEAGPTAPAAGLVLHSVHYSQEWDPLSSSVPGALVLD